MDTPPTLRRTPQPTERTVEVVTQVRESSPLRVLRSAGESRRAGRRAAPQTIVDGSPGPCQRTVARRREGPQIPQEDGCANPQKPTAIRDATTSAITTTGTMSSATWRRAFMTAASSMTSEITPARKGRQMCLLYERLVRAAIDARLASQVPPGVVPI